MNETLYTFFIYPIYQCTLASQRDNTNGSEARDMLKLALFYLRFMVILKSASNTRISLEMGQTLLSSSKKIDEKVKNFHILFNRKM